MHYYSRAASCEYNLFDFPKPAWWLPLPECSGHQLFRVTISIAKCQPVIIVQLSNCTTEIFRKKPITTAIEPLGACSGKTEVVKSGVTRLTASNIHHHRHNAYDSYFVRSNHALEKTEQNGGLPPPLGITHLGHLVPHPKVEWLQRLQQHRDPRIGKPRKVSS